MANRREFSEDLCKRLKDDGTICGAHVGFGAVILHLNDCGEHGDENEDDEDDEDLAICLTCGDELAADNMDADGNCEGCTGEDADGEPTTD